MATVRWLGSAPTIPQVTTITITAADVATTYTVTINGKNVSAAGASTAALCAAALQAALASTSYQEFREITWANAAGTNTITGTAVKPGKPFSLTTTKNNGTGTISSATTTANSSPNDFSLPANFSGGALPAAGDDLAIDSESVQILYGLEALANITLNSLTISSNYTGWIGLPSVDSDYGYTQYRPLNLKTKASNVYIGAGTGKGSQNIQLDLSTGATTVSVYNTATRSAGTNSVPPLLLNMANAANILNILSGTVGIGFYGETGTIGTVNIGSSGTKPVVSSGANVTISTLSLTAGMAEAAKAPTTVIQTAGTLNICRRGGTVTTATIAGGILNVLGGTITTLNLIRGAGKTKGGTVNFDGMPGNKTVTNCSVDYGCTLTNTNGGVTFTHPITFANGCLPFTGCTITIPTTSTITLGIG